MKGEDDVNRAAIYENSYEVLEPQIAKLRSLEAYCQEAVAFFSSVVSNLSAPVDKKERKSVFTHLIFLGEVESVSEELIWYLCSLLDVIMTIDTVKNMKAGLINDSSNYKRYVGVNNHICSAFQFLKDRIPNSMEELMKIGAITQWLATQNKIIMDLKAELKKIKGYVFWDRQGILPLDSKMFLPLSFKWLLIFSKRACGSFLKRSTRFFASSHSAFS